MDYTQLGRSGARVSRIILGTMNLGTAVDAADSHRLLDNAVDQGINFIDTANIYGHTPGATEQIIGTWFSQNPGRRDEVFLSTKVSLPMGPGPNDRGLSALQIRKACEDSLRRLQTDHIDLYLMHHIDRTTPVDEIWEALDLLRSQGKVLYTGSSNFAGWHIAHTQEAALAGRRLGLVAEQSIYNLMCRWAELEVIPAAQHYGLGVIPYSPVHGGMLSGVLRKQREGRAQRSGTGIWATQMEAQRDQLQRYEDLCDELGHTPAEVALAWLLGRPGITGPIIGPRTQEHLDGAIRSVHLTLDGETLWRLDEIFPAPGPNGSKPAPEAYTF